MKRLRLFFGFPLDEEIKDKIFVFLKKQNLFKKDYKWVAKENYHITLKFLGEVEENYVEELFKIGNKVSSIFKEFSAYTGEFSGFPEKRRARVFFLDLKEKDKFKEVFEKLEEELFKLNFEKEKREYHPHITLARIKGFEILPDLEPLVLNIKIRGFNLYESILRKEGPLYKILKLFSFRRNG